MMGHPLFGVYPIQLMDRTQPEISYNLDFDGSRGEKKKMPIVDVLDDVYSHNHYVYLSPEQPIVHRYCNTFLMRFELQDNKVLMSRRIEEATETLTVILSIAKSDREDKDEMEWTSYHKEFHPYYSYGRAEYGEKWQTIEHSLGDGKYRYIKLNVTMTIFLLMLKKTTNIPKRNGNGFTQLKYNGGIIRVHKKTLSDELEYFKQLFDNNKHQSYYHINVDFVDMMEVIFTLNPINKPIRNGLTYGALYRVSQQLKCIKLAEKCEDFIEKIRLFKPLDAAFLAYEGGIECESKLFLAAKQSDISLEQQFRNQRGRGFRRVIKEFSHREL